VLLFKNILFKTIFELSNINHKFAMKNMNRKLITVANYAKKISSSTTWVYTLIKMGRIECEIIDGIKFIVIWEKEKT
jgi:hypothetical protein